MKITFKHTATVMIAALGLSVAACDGPNEEAMEEQGDAMVEGVEAEADAMEDAGQITDAQEDAMVENAEDKADAMEDKGEAMDDGAVVAE
ncbi:hypothetical protein [Porphyrobacter sp. AAP60]|uniref:hypothetical protein n=1 Tax=Porphyrobacter sp. AAP60 TaxID=1523423 RepID=UPI0006B989AA|nr:hypothetical protein [Porphyrobacter sp. AAP60]KPF64117.1 hypothetical protein IP79_08835 [Porphyrobacter sp. AAP60]